MFVTMLRNMGFLLHLILLGGECELLWQECMQCNCNIQVSSFQNELLNPMSDKIAFFSRYLFNKYLLSLYYELRAV